MPLPPMIHNACNTQAGPRLVIADDGDSVYVAWCPTCDRALSTIECSRRLEAEDLAVEQILAAIGSNTVQ